MSKQTRKQLLAQVRSQRVALHDLNKKSDRMTLEEFLVSACVADPRRTAYMVGAVLESKKKEHRASVNRHFSQTRGLMAEARRLSKELEANKLLLDTMTTENARLQGELDANVGKKKRRG